MLKEKYNIPEEEEDEDPEVDDFAVDQKDIEEERVVVDFKTRFERAKTRYLEKVHSSPGGKDAQIDEMHDGTVVGEANADEEEDI